MAEQQSVSDSARMFTRVQASALYRDYQTAFERAVGLPLELHRPGIDRVIRPRTGAPFCNLMARAGQSCESCLALQSSLEQQAGFNSKTLKCFAGMSETAVPVRIGGDLIGYLHTGHVLVGEATRKKFERVTTQLIEWGNAVNAGEYEQAYFSTRVFSSSQYESVVRLLEVFSRHLASCGELIPPLSTQYEPAAVKSARQLIETHSSENLTQSAVARVVNVSAGYFCEMFKKTTGVTFVNYLARVRVEKSKLMLRDPARRISEVAFEVGFQSLSQFNRTFKKLEGCAPGDYRRRFVEV